MFSENFQTFVINQKLSLAKVFRPLTVKPRVMEEEEDRKKKRDGTQREERRKREQEGEMQTEKDQ